MKHFLFILIALTALQTASAQEPVSLNSFMEKDPVEQAKIIAKAPPAQKEELSRIQIHLILLRRYGTEQKINTLKEAGVARARGFFNLSLVRSDYQNLWDQYQIHLDTAGMTPAQRAEADQMFEHERLMDEKRLERMHDLLFRLAPTPQALELDKEVAKLREAFRREMGQNESSSSPLQKEDVVRASRQMDQLIEQLAKLPALTPAQVQKEFDEYPEGRLELGF